MDINTQIKYEREKLNLSREKFVKCLFEKTGLKVSQKTVQRWEKGESLSTIEVQCLSELFDVKASDLIDVDKEPIAISKESLYNFGKKILDYSSIDNFKDLMELFYITNNARVQFVPRYDIELQGVNNLLSSESDDFQAIRFINHFFYWLEGCNETDTTNNLHESIMIHEDTVGSRSRYDPRTILDAEEMTLIKEGIISELYWFTHEVSDHLYEKDENRIINSNYFVKNNIFS
ncbi:helix-turn-helix domain-containing protein [Dellaglioa sp. L3N]